MQIAFIAGVQPIEEVKELSKTLESRGHTVTTWDTSRVALTDFTSDNLRQLFKGYDLVYYRTGFTDAGRLLLGRAASEFKEKMPVFLNQNYLADSCITNKIYQSGLAMRAGMATPETYLGKNHSFSLLSEAFGTPFILKAAHGIKGNKVFLINSEKDYMDLLPSIQGDVLAQRFIKNNGDYRVFVLGGRVVEIYKRTPSQGEFRNNVSLGGVGERVEDESLLGRLKGSSSLIIDALDLDIAGIDLIQSETDGELYFLEANINPGWKGLEKALEIDFTKEVADYIESRVS